MSAAEKEENVPQPVPQQDSRWWEGYIIRYAVGTVVGGMCVYFILHTLGADAKALWLMQPDITQLHLDALIDICKNTNSEACLVQAQLAQDLYGFNFPQLALLGVYGLAFNYIASAPVLVFHAVRSSFTGDKLCLICDGSVFCLMLLVCGFISGFFILTKFNGGMLFLFIYVALQLSMIICRCSSSKSFIFYKNLHSARQWGAIDVTSYKHLREHGNAFLIVLHNLFFMYVVISLSELFKIMSWQGNLIGFEVDKIVFLSVLWIFPASLVYFIGHGIESDMVSDYKNKKAKAKANKKN